MIELAAGRANRETPRGERWEDQLQWGPDTWHVRTTTWRREDERLHATPLLRHLIGTRGGHAFPRDFFFFFFSFLSSLFIHCLSFFVTFFVCPIFVLLI